LSTVAIASCVSCGRGFIQRESRFCSDRCREWFDGGNPPYTSYDANDYIAAVKPRPATDDGCLVCSKRIVAAGRKRLKFCSDACRKKASRNAQKHGSGQGQPKPKNVHFLSSDNNNLRPPFSATLGLPINLIGGYRWPGAHLDRETAREILIREIGR
jgi:predicted nucleic acid-binding Zn ribbon protein